MTRRRNPFAREKLAGELIAKYEALRTELLRSQNHCGGGKQDSSASVGITAATAPIERGQSYQNCKEVCQVPQCRD